MKYFLPERLDFALTRGLVRAALFNCGGRHFLTRPGAALPHVGALLANTEHLHRT